MLDLEITELYNRGKKVPPISMENFNKWDMIRHYYSINWDAKFDFDSKRGYYENDSFGILEKLQLDYYTPNLEE